MRNSIWTVTGQYPDQKAKYEIIHIACNHLWKKDGTYIATVSGHNTETVQYNKPQIKVSDYLWVEESYESRQGVEYE